MILTILQSRCHPAICGPAGRFISLGKRLAVIAIAGSLIVIPVMPQSSDHPPVSASAPSKSNTPREHTPQPDKARARAAFQAGRRAEQSGDWKEEFAAYSEATAYDPTNREYAVLKEHARFQVVQGLVDSAERQAVAGNIPNARVLLRQALEIDPKYAVAQERLQELPPSPAGAESEKVPQLGGLPRLIFKPGKSDFDYRGTIRGAYGEIGKQFGVTIIFDGELPERPVHFQAPNVDFDTAVRVLSRQTRTFTRVVDAHTMFVTADTPQKEREYAPEVEKEIVLSAAVTTDEMNEAVRIIREMTGITRTQLNAATHTLTVRSTEQNVALAQALVDQVEQPRGEVMLEIEILELDRTAAHQLGIIPPSSSSVFALTLPEIRQLQAAQNNGTLIQILQTIFGSSAVSSATGAALPALIAFGGGKTIFLATMPSVTAEFSQALNAVRSAQRVLLRAEDGKPATFFVGDRYPIDLGLLSADLSPVSTALTQTLSQTLLSGLSLPRTDYATGKSPVSVAIANFVTSGGHPDLVVANQADGTISILLGNGDGTFGAQTPIAIPAGGVAASPSAVATGDFNNDGNVDIAVTDMANNRVLIFLGRGDGTFQAPVAYATGNNPVALVAQDFDDDGEPDLAVVNQGDGKTASTVSVLLGNKINGVQNGTFAAKTDYPVGVSPSAITTGIFNTGGFTSLAVTNKANNTVSVLLGTGTNGMQNGVFAAQTTFATGNGPAGVTTADFNNDGHLDLAVTNETDGTVSILLGMGDGTFFAHTDFATGSGPVGIVAANFTGTNTDLAVADESSNNVDVLVGNGDGTFMTPISLPTGNSPVSVAAADLIGNGAIDLVTANNSSNTVTVTLNTLQTAPNSPASQIGYPGAEYVDLGLKVQATPRLHDDGEVTLQLQFDIKSLTGTNINGIPILSNRNIEQTIRLREDETSVLSGIIQKNQSRSVSGLPWLSTAPGIGYLTGEETTNEQDTEMLIIVTPHALRAPPHDVPAIYAGWGEPSTAPSAQPPPPVPRPAPAGAPQPGQPFPPQAGRPRIPGGLQPGPEINTPYPPQQ